MTSGNSYDEALNAEINKYENAYLQPLSKYREIPTIPTELVDLLAYERNINQRVLELQRIKIPPLSFDAMNNVNKYYDALEEQQQAKKQQLREQAEMRKQAMQKEHEDAIRNANSYNSDLIKPIKSKHEELLSYKDDLSYVFEHYDITPLDIDISDTVTIDEFSTLIDESINTCLKYKKKDSKIFGILTKPIQGETNLAFTLCYLGLVILVIYFALPILAIPAFLLMFLSVHGMYKDLEKLRIARALMTQLDYNRFVPEEQFKHVDDIDTSSVDEELAEQLSLVKDFSTEKSAALQKLNEESSNICKRCEEVRQKVAGEYATVIDNLLGAAKEAHEKIESLMKDYAPFPTVQNKSVVMSHRYTLGRLEGKLDVTAELPMLNIVFNSADRETALNTMKLYLSNALLSVRVKQLTIEIYDPKNMCGDFTEFFTPETKPYIKPNNMTLEELLKTYREYSQQNVLVLDKKPIDEYNMDAEKRELVPKDYKLLLLISETDKLNEGDQKRLFTEYFKFSASTGVMIWLLDSKRWPNSIWVDGSYSMKGESIKYTPELGKKAVSTFITALAEYKDTGIDYISKFGNVFIPKEKWWTFDTIKGIKMPFGLENGDPTRGLNVAPVLNDGNVHALLGGATGAGKSAAINQLLISLITMYPPSELLLIYIDFKNVEAAKFTGGYDLKKNEWMPKEEVEVLRKNGEYYTRMSRIPHLKIISGTTDGEYALSVFEFLMGEMAHRQELINKYGVTKIQSMREDILDKYNKMKGTPNGTWLDMRKDWDWYKPNVYDVYGDLPRLLVIFDEFQVMYNPEFVDARTIDQINGKITAFTKLARAMSAHFWFTSQSMKGTMSKDTMANFSLRGALRCTSDVSEELIGNKAAGTIRAKFGFMYSNDSAGQDPNANRLWRVPFLDDKHKDADTREFRDMFDYVDKVNELLEPFNEKSYMAEFYDEKLLVPSSVLVDWYATHHETFCSPDVFILGERANYSTNKAPVTISLQEDGGENVMIAAFDRNDMLNLTMTMIKNLQLSDDVTIIMNVQDKETHTLLDVENIVDPKFLSLSYPKQDIPEFIDALNGMVERRLEIGGPYTPVYVFCVQWERCPGISVETNYKLGDKFKDVIRKAPTVGVHFVFSSREKLEMQRFIPAACNHRICGLMPKDSAFFIETGKVEKLPDAGKDAGLFAFYEFGTTLTKFRIYQHTYTKTIKSREIVL